MSTPLASHLRARGAVVGVNGAIYRLQERIYMVEPMALELWKRPVKG